MQYLLEMRQIKKEFDGIPVLQEGNLKIRPGEIHALLGENGAGKTTLLHILLGMKKIQNTGGFSGEILWEGKPVKIASSRQAMAMGIGMVHQEFLLLDSFSVAENIGLNQEPVKKTWFSRIFGKEFEKIENVVLKERGEKALSLLGLKLDQDYLAGMLSVSSRQMIEIARELSREQRKILLFDEPTAALSEKEARRLLQVMRQLADKGIAILLITHRLDEVKQIADSVTILRNGKTVMECACADISIQEMAQQMIGRAMVQKEKQRTTLTEKTILTIQGMKGNYGIEQIKGVDLEVRKGEILGITGLAGHGRTAFAKILMGLAKADGEMKVKEKRVPIGNVKSAIEAGMAFVGEERKENGLLLGSSIEENICISAIILQNKFIWKNLLFHFEDGKAKTEWARKMIEKLDIRCSGPKQKVSMLSGGNQQKVALARALTLKPEILVVSEMTRGIDVGAKQKILEILLEQNKKDGLTMITIGSELEELKKICHRIAVIHKGRIQGILDAEAEEEAFSQLIAREEESYE